MRWKGAEPTGKQPSLATYPVDGTLLAQFLTERDRDARIAELEWQLHTAQEAAMLQAQNLQQLNDALESTSYQRDYWRAVAMHRKRPRRSTATNQQPTFPRTPL